KTYNTRYSLVVTDPTTNPALTGLSMGERTGSRVLRWVWLNVLDLSLILVQVVSFYGRTLGVLRVTLDGNASYVSVKQSLRRG
ncbi:hypothetical protein LX36DRAFT_576204, partial [Colletotrichum falcatum]